MNILIIGNGFDIEHDLPTHYIDFLDWAGLQKNKICAEINEVVFANVGIKDEVDCLKKDNIWLYHFLQLNRTDVLLERGWIDFEKQIGEIINALEGNVIKNKPLMISFYNTTPQYSISTFLTQGYVYLKGGNTGNTGAIELVIGSLGFYTLIEYLYQDLRRFTRLFEIYCHFYINAIIKEKLKRLKENPNSNFGWVLSFNYTNSYDALYDKQKLSRYCYIHGLAQESPKNTNIVLGIDDALERLKDNEVNTIFDFVKFKKYFQRIDLRTGSEYRDWIKIIKENVKRKVTHNDTIQKIEISIVGHSMGKTDHEVLGEFLNLTEKGNEVYVKIYYHDDKAKTNLIQRTIEIIGKKALIDRVHGSDSTIQFIYQYDEVEGLFKKRE